MGVSRDLDGCDLGGFRGDGLSDFGIQPLIPADWPELRRVRLRALADAPHAFISARGDEAQWRERDWRQTFETGLWAVARSNGLAVAVARMSREPSELPRRHVEAVWTEPSYRRRGVAQSLILWLIEHETRLGATDIHIWVIEPNPGARRLYEAIGFRPTGERQPLGERVEARLRFTTSERMPG
jgi:GNAT superfamily N-acetyltransferase